MKSTLLSLACVLALCPLLLGCDHATETVESSPPPAVIDAEVVTTGGTVRGLVRDDGLKEYQGIPYAAPPVGPPTARHRARQSSSTPGSKGSR